MLKSTILSVLAFTMPMAFAREDRACTFEWTSNSVFCSSGLHEETIPDGECFLLHGSQFVVDNLQPTCRGMHNTKPQPRYMDLTLASFYISGQGLHRVGKTGLSIQFMYKH